MTSPGAPGEPRGWATEAVCADRHERQRKYIGDAETLLRTEANARIAPIEARLATQETETMGLRDWRHEDAASRKPPLGAILSAIGLVLTLASAGVAAWIAEGQRLTRIEVRVEGLTTSVEKMTDAIEQGRDQRAQIDSGVASRMSGLDVTLQALAERLRLLESRRRGPGE